MNDPAYVPMVWCTDDVDAGISPATAASLASQHRGRVWLIFNEPDNNAEADNCGYFIDIHYSKPPYNIFYFDDSMWPDLGKYLAKQYIRYYDAIVAADPTARLFAFGGTFLPGAAGEKGTKAQLIWGGFSSYLHNPFEEANTAPRPLHGIAVHAYANHSADCGIGDAACLELALANTHNFFQNALPGVTAARPIWITETGYLAKGGSQPGSPEGRATAQSHTDAVLTRPLLEWFTTNAAAGGSFPFYDGIAWYSTHSCRQNPGAPITDYTASDLLDIGPVNCPLSEQPTAQKRTVIGETWAAAQCDTCASDMTVGQ